MRNRRWTPILAALAAALLILPAPGGAQDARAPRAGQGPGTLPVAWLLNQSSELGLEAGQVQRLESIAGELRERNAPLHAAFRAAVEEGRIPPAVRRGPAAGERAEMRRRMQERSPEEREAMRERMRERRESMTEEGRRELREHMSRQRGRAALRQRAEARERMSERRAAIEADEELAAAMRQLRENRRWAAEQVRSVLTAEQQARARELMRARIAPRANRQAPERRR